MKGVLETDALAPLVADLEDPQPLVEMLEDAGWKAAWIGPLEGVAVVSTGSGATACPQTMVLKALAQTVEVTAAQGLSAGLQSGSSLLAVCGSWCIPWRVETQGLWSPWNCGSAQYVFKDCERIGQNCGFQCNYVKRYQRTQSRSVGWVYPNCSTSTVAESRTEYFEQLANCQYLTASKVPNGCATAGANAACLVGPACSPTYPAPAQPDQGAPLCGTVGAVLACPPAATTPTVVTDWQ